jgi:hypothetical protein
MRIRRVEKRDFMHEADNAAPTAAWTAVDGSWAINTRKLRASHNGGTTIGTCYWTGGIGATTQNERLCYDVDMDIINSAAGWWAAAIITADAQAGRYLGNSVVIYIDATDIKVYTSAANVLTQRHTATSAHSSGNNYHLEIDFDPSSGAITIYQDSHDASDFPEAVTSVISETSTTGFPWSGDINVGLACEKCTCDFGWYQIHRPNHTQIINGSVRWSHYLGKRPGHFRFASALDDDNDSTLEFGESDHIEILLEDGTRFYREFYGRIENEDKDTSRGVTVLTGRDILQQLAVNEADLTLGGATQQSGHITQIISGSTDDLPTIDVKAGGDNYDVDYEGRTAYDSVMAMAQQLKYSVWATAWGKVNATDTYAASGITIDNDDDVVLDVKLINDTFDLANTVHVYYNAGDELRTDGTSQTAYGKRGGSNPGGIIINWHIADAGSAQDLGDGVKDWYKDVLDAVVVNVADYHELNIGETVTLELDNMGVTGASALVMEKHFDDRYPWITFFCDIYTAGTPIPRVFRDPALTMDKGKHLGQDGQAWVL